ncbi:MAG: hypothetical protein EBR32_05315 [Bacteroidetes bacterium]|nr:hypothetical protein [Bacteroidota bacterium]
MGLKSNNMVCCGELRSILVVLSLIFISSLLNSKTVIAQGNMLSMDTVISFSADTSEGILYGFNNRSLELFAIQNERVQVLDTIQFRYNMEYSVYYEQNKDRMPRESKLIHYYRDPNTNEKSMLFWDAGLGRVHTYNFNSKELQQLDFSYDMRSFYGHGSWVDNTTLDIYALGGYGEFVHKHNFLKFDQAFQEWTEIQTLGKKPADDLFGQLYFDSARNRYLYIQRIWDLKIVIYELSALSYEWKFINIYDFDSSVRDADYNSYPITGNYTFLGEDWLSLHNNMMLNLETNQLFIVKNPSINQKINKTLGMFPTGGKDSVLIFGDLNNMDKQLGVMVVPLEDVLGFLEPISSKTSFSAWYTLILVVILSVFGLGFVRYKNMKPSHLSTSMQFNEAKTSVMVQCKKRTIHFDEAVDLRFWDLVKTLKEQRVNSISFSDFDNSIFDEHYQANQYSIKRGQLIKHINRKLEVDFVETRKENHDKRFKRIVFDFKALDN